jgi:OOP family OmpA-OmpF porin
VVRRSPRSRRSWSLVAGLPWLVLVLFVAGGISPVLAKPDGARLIVSPLAGYGILSEWSDLNDAPYFGAGFGFLFNNHLGAEGIWGYSQPDSRTLPRGQVKMRHLGVDLRYHPVPGRRINPYVAAGWTELRLVPDEGVNGDYNGWEVGAGVTMSFTDGPYHRISLRVDGRDVMAKFDPPLPSDGAYHHNFMITAGLQIEIGDDWHRDTDRDGVIDRADDCPDTDRRMVVDARGCPIDSDGDGVFDGIDACAMTPTGAVIDSLGCPIDTDGDGVFDGLDQCEDTPAGAVIDTTGCPLDSDVDQVFDGLDQCPDTPAGVRVDADGCPSVESPQEQELYDNGTLTFDSVQFESNKAELKPQSFPALDLIGSILVKWPRLKIEIGGYTDSRGQEEKNRQLSQERADAVRTYLLDKFDNVHPDQLTAVGYGPDNPVASNDTEEGRQQNRRVEFKILEGNPKR